MYREIWGFTWVIFRTFRKNWVLPVGIVNLKSTVLLK